MVVPICGELEWNRNDAEPEGCRKQHGPHIGRIRRLGMRSILSGQVVPTSLERAGTSIPHNSERTDPDSSGSSAMCQMCPRVE